MKKLICLLGVLAGGSLQALPIEFQSTENRTPLLELYTSEGCSSCPPAESWLSKLKTAPGLWRDFVPVAFHVAYWNNLGWRDRLSSEEFSSRQQEYAQGWSAETIYTPEFVLNGQEWHDWFGLRGAPSVATTKAGVLRVRSQDGKHWQATFAPAGTGTSNYDVTAAVLVSGLGSDVNAGENAGRHLNHDFAALSLMIRPMTPAKNGYSGNFIIDNAPKGVTGRLALAVWVSRSGQLEPLQATGAWLPPAEPKAMPPSPARN